jgi:hypothetical protein
MNNNSEFKRLNFFTGFFTTADDWNEGQTYHLEKRKLHNRLLHRAGVMEGLDVVVEGGLKVIVEAGAALDFASDTALDNICEGFQGVPRLLQVWRRLPHQPCRLWIHAGDRAHFLSAHLGLLAR